MDTVLQSAVMTFVSLLRSNWFQVKQLGQKVVARDPEEFLYDWLQASWEMLVEAAVALSKNEIVFLEPYGQGADCNEVGSRVWDPGISSTHSVNVLPLHGKEMLDRITGNTFSTPENGLVLEEFVTMTDTNWYLPEPPFDHVLIFMDGIPRVVSLEEVFFSLEGLS